MHHANLPISSHQALSITIHNHHQPANPSITASTTIPCIRFLMAAATNTKQQQPAPKPEFANGEKSKAVVDQENLEAGVIRRIEEEKAKAAAAAMEAKAVLEKKATASSGWKERVAGGLEQLTDMKWADSVVEKARNNKEVVAIAIAAFSLGFFVSHKLFRK